MLHLHSATKSFKGPTPLHGLPAYRVFDIGENILRNRIAERHVVSFTVSDREWNDFPGQAADATEFLSKHFERLRELIESHRVDDADLDFPIWSRLGKGFIVQVDVLPKELVRLAGMLGLSITMSQYPVRATGDAV